MSDETRYVVGFVADGQFVSAGYEPVDSTTSLDEAREDLLMWQEDWPGPNWGVYRLAKVEEEGSNP
ncbi:hypothetical protein [Nocardia sp. NPDC051463]|uniref:hypothetical protein n=1 Tax=Nocardia sp. NPDC051463 TaxID=3154845 RepID=UPI00344C5B75